MKQIILSKGNNKGITQNELNSKPLNIQHVNSSVMSDKFLPLAAMEKLLKQGGADRISDKAKVALKNALEDIASEIAAKSIKLTVHAGRKTVKAEDIKLAVKE